MKSAAAKAGLFAVLLFLIAGHATAQSRNNARGSVDLEGTVLSVTAWRTKKVDDPIRVENLRLYENGIEQKIRNLSPDSSPSRIVLIVDNSQTLRADLESLKNAVLEFAYEIYEGDQLFVIAFDEKPEIIQEWTDNAEKIRKSLATFRKKGNPYLFDALTASSREILAPLMPGIRKTAVVVIGDGLDRGSKAEFDSVLSELRSLDISVYALQLPDRTGGAFRRNQPKAGSVISQLTEGTGGRIFPFEEARGAAQEICDELRKNRYLLSYVPTNTSSFDARSLFVLGDEGISVRTKTAHPPTIR